MPFNPKQAYQIVEDLITIKDFSDYSEDFVTRPPYQRKNVWATKKKQNLLDSLFRRYYIPKIVVREVRLGETKTIEPTHKLLFMVQQCPKMLHFKAKIV